MGNPASNKDLMKKVGKEEDEYIKATVDKYKE